MYLQNNDISSLPDNVSIPSNNKVGRLDLSHNKFTSVPSNFLKNFKTLRYLNLCKYKNYTRNLAFSQKGVGELWLGSLINSDLFVEKIAQYLIIDHEYVFMHKFLFLGCGNLAAVPPVFELAGSLHILDLRSSKIPTLQSQSFSDGSTPSSLTELILEDNTLTGKDTFTVLD